MKFAIIKKTDDYVLSLETNSRDPQGNEDWYEIQTDFNFSPHVHNVWWKYDGVSSFTNEGERKTQNETEIYDNVVNYATLLESLGFTGNPQKLSEIETWMIAEFDSLTTLTEVKDFAKNMFLVVGKAIAALVYGWQLKKD